MMQRPNAPPVAAPRDLSDLGQLLGKLVRGRLWLQILIGMVAGVGVGLLLSPHGGGGLSTARADVVADWLALPGEVFLTMIRMIVIPLVVSSIVLGIADSHDLTTLRRVGLRIAPYFLATTTVAVVIGFVVTTLIAPGDAIDGAALVGATSDPVQVTHPDLPAPKDRILALLPGNPLAAVLDESMLQIVVLAIFSGVAMASMEPGTARPLVDLTRAVRALAMKVVSWAMVLAPVAVFGLLAQIMIRVGLEALLGVGAYVLTVLTGLAALFGFHLLLVRFVGRRPIRGFLRAIRSVLLLAFSTSSSAAVMPLSLRTAKESLEVDASVANFVIPVGATVNMDGTALYQVCAALFLAQAFGVELSTAQFLLLAGTTVGASIGSPSAPGVGIAILATVLAQVGIPSVGIALIIGVDRILDMSRTAVNVTGDLTACLVLDRWLSPRSRSAGGQAPEPPPDAPHTPQPSPAPDA